MSRTTKTVLLVLSLALVSFTVAGGLGVKASTGDGAYRQLGVYSEVLSRIRSDYVEEPNIALVTDGALHGLLESLDANSSYLNPTEYKQYKDLKQSKGTIGAAISKRFGYAAVISVVPGGPADKANIEAGDIFEAIEGKSSRDMSLAEIHGVLSGAPGSSVSVSVVRPRKAQPDKVSIIRESVKEPAATAKMMEDGVGYIKADGFPKGRAQEIASKIKELQRQGAKRFVLDLRNSGDGDEQEGIETANLFINHGLISYVQGQKYPRQNFDADPAKAITTAPLVVVVNRSTAGPAEIIASAILETARGDVVGDKTFGTGSIQKLIELPDSSALILSIAKYFSPSGKAIQDSAVTPNILVADNLDDFTGPDDETDNNQPEVKKTAQPDEQLRRAIEVLKNKDQKTANAAALRHAA
ncbi:MAG TPA: S41 family peptidase [Terriglobales bacterium]|nr:S41 family peptidase [Terriglobales bacterium]